MVVAKRRGCGCSKNDFFPEESFNSWGSYVAALKHTKSRLADRALTRSLEQTELTEVRARSQHDMKKNLTWWDLIWFGVGAVIGAGIFVLTGQEAQVDAGPAVVLSYVVSGVSAMLSVFCYTEFAVEIPVAEAFKDICVSLEFHGVAPFSHACSLVSVLFGFLGIAFKFAEMDYVAKVGDLQKASKSVNTLNLLLDHDIQQNDVRKGCSHTRNLLRVKRGLDMVRVLFQQILVTEGNMLREPASVAYAQVFNPYHGWAIRKAVAAGMYALPTRVQLLKKLNEEEDSARIQMQSYVTASAPIINYIDQLFISRGLGIDW